MTISPLLLFEPSQIFPCLIITVSLPETDLPYCGIETNRPCTSTTKAEVAKSILYFRIQFPQQSHFCGQWIFWILMQQKWTGNFYVCYSNNLSLNLSILGSFSEIPTASKEYIFVLCPVMIERSTRHYGTPVLKYVAWTASSSTHSFSVRKR